MNIFDRLTHVGEVNLSESHDLLGVWYDYQTEGFYLGTDNCPTPWENYYSLDDFTGPLTAEQACEEAFNLYKGYEPDEFHALLSEISDWDAPPVAMLIYVWEYLQDLTKEYHSNGGLLIVTDRDPLDVYNANLDNYLLSKDALPEPDFVYPIDSDEERVVVFPDAGCC